MKVLEYNELWEAVDYRGVKAAAPFLGSGFQTPHVPSE